MAVIDEAARTGQLVKLSAASRLDAYRGPQPRIIYRRFGCALPAR